MWKQFWDLNSTVLLLKSTQHCASVYYDSLYLFCSEISTPKLCLEGLDNTIEKFSAHIIAPNFLICPEFEFLSEFVKSIICVLLLKCVWDPFAWSPCRLSSEQMVSLVLGFGKREGICRAFLIHLHWSHTTWPDKQNTITNEIKIFFIRSFDFHCLNSFLSCQISF